MIVIKCPALFEINVSFFSTAKLSGATSSYNVNIETYVFLEKYLHDFLYKNMLRIGMALAFDFTSDVFLLNHRFQVLINAQS
jgi:hypothetical protein